MLPTLALLQLLLLAGTWPLAILALCGVFDRIATPEAVRALWLDLPLWMGLVWGWAYLCIVRGEWRRMARNTYRDRPGPNEQPIFRSLGGMKMKSKFSGWLVVVIAACFWMFASTGMADIGTAFAKAPVLEHPQATVPDLDSVLGTGDAEAVAVTAVEHSDIDSGEFDALAFTVTAVNPQPREHVDFAGTANSRAWYMSNQQHSTGSPGWSSIRLSG